MAQENTATQATTATSTSGTATPANGTGTTATAAAAPAQSEDKAKAKTPTLDELSLELAKANAETARLKNSISKLTSENKKLSDWQKERMSAQEKQEQEDAQAKAERDAYIKSLEDYKAINEASKRYLSMGMEVDLAIATATAENSGDMDTVMKNIKANSEAQITAAKAEWLKSRPDIPAGGNGSNITKEQFDAMSLVERTKLRREDLETYERFVGRK